MLATLDTHVAYLTAAGTGDSAHSTDSLLNHLIATQSIVKDWGCRQALCDAALFHSVYGTDTYLDQTLALDRRSEVAALIGPEAEHLVFLFCTKDRPSYLEAVDALPSVVPMVNRLEGGTMRLAPSDLLDIVQIEAANALEQWGRIKPENKRRAAPMLRCIFPHVRSADGRDRIALALQDVVPVDPAASQPTTQGQRP